MPGCMIHQQTTGDTALRLPQTRGSIQKKCRPKNVDERCKEPDMSQKCGRVDTSLSRHAVAACEVAIFSVLSQTHIHTSGDTVIMHINGTPQQHIWHQARVGKKFASDW